MKLANFIFFFFLSADEVSRHPVKEEDNTLYFKDDIPKVN